MKTELAIMQDSSIRNDVARVKSIWRMGQELEGVLYRTRKQMLITDHQMGAILVGLKGKVGHGNWMTFLQANFSDMDRSPHTIQRIAERSMRVFNDNSDVKSSNVNEFTPESIRKRFWYDMPVKPREALMGDEKNAPQAHYLTCVNNFFKWDRQVVIGQASAPETRILQHDFEQMVRRIIQLCSKEWVKSLCNE